MEQTKINPITIESAKQLAINVIKKEFVCNVKSIKYLGGGSFGYAYKVDIDVSPYTVVMKACRCDNMCEREAFELKLLAKDSLIHIPKVYFTYLKDDIIPIDFICMEYINGKNCFTDFSKLFLSKSKKREFADKVTSAMYVWHSKTNEKFGSIQNPIFDEWLDLYKPFAFDILQSAEKMVNEGRLEPYFLKTMERAWDNFDYIFSEKVECASLIHGDLNVMNIMTDDNLNPIAIIDPLESKWADAEFDLFQLKNLTGNTFGLYEMYKSKYPTSKNCDLKVAFYAMYHEIYCYISSGRRTKINHLRCLLQLKKELKNVRIHF
ncbi:fructosamine kinase family protein [uncultured Eubacterium sp.]|uniref:fructosamine kinase family protein n=1 Tax=uncultured Eubacterium sp. TaxID=165185 RepID=UPI0015BDEE16|nr:fructosamine kinase family protein [uncultured Eubacterium sp.]